jgi:acetyl esterase/lipase
MRNATKKSGQITWISTALLALNLFRSDRNKIFGFFWPFKMLAGGLSPFLGLISLLGGLYHTFRKNIWPALAGLGSAVIAADHLRRLARRYPELEQTYPDFLWTQVPLKQRQRMLAQPYTPIPPNPPDNAPIQDICYGKHQPTGQSLMANIWFPEDDIPPSDLVIIHVFGGAWHYLHKDFGTRKLFRHLTAQGHTILDINYTLAPDTGLVDMVRDVKQAVQWVRKTIPDIRGQRTKIVLMGVSSGAHLAMLTGFTPNHPHFQPDDRTDTAVDGVISSYGLTDLREAYVTFKFGFGHILTTHTWFERRMIDFVSWLLRKMTFMDPDREYIDPGDWLDSLLGGSPFEFPDRYEQASPITHAGSHCPPTLFLQGTHDFTRILPGVKKTHHKLQKAGVKSTLVCLEHTEHAFDAPVVNFPVWAPATQVAIYHIERFLAVLQHDPRNY